MQGNSQNVQLTNNSLEYGKTENSKTKMVPDNSFKFKWSRFKKSLLVNF